MCFFNKIYICHKCGKVEDVFPYPKTCPVCGNKLQLAGRFKFSKPYQEQVEKALKQIPPEEIDPELREKRIKYEHDKFFSDSGEEDEYFEKFLLKERSKPVVACPYCKSTNTTKISAMTKATRYAAFGVLAVGANSKQWHCNNCNSNF